MEHATRTNLLGVRRCSTVTLDKQHHTYKETTDIIIRLMLHGVVVVMAQEKEIEVREDVKASLLYMNSTDKY